jgi:urease accessory protein
MNLTELTSANAAAAGSGRLRFECAEASGRTRLVDAFAASPLKIVQPRNHGSAVWAVTSTYGGGLLGGDNITLDVDVGENAQAVLMSQASTKVYRSDFPSRQALTARVGSGGLLISVPDRVACFAGSAFQQEQKIELAADANAVVLDWLVGGRVASGERWEFDHYASRIEISRAGKRVFLESLLLDAQHGTLSDRMRRFNTLAALVIVGPALNTGAQALYESIAAQPVERSAQTVCAASQIGTDGVVLRWAGVDVETVGREIRKALRFVSELIGDDPWARRW